MYKILRHAIKVRLSADCGIERTIQSRAHQPQARRPGLRNQVVLRQLGRREALAHVQKRGQTAGGQRLEAAHGNSRDVGHSQRHHTCAGALLRIAKGWMKLVSVIVILIVIYILVHSEQRLKRLMVMVGISATVSAITPALARPCVSWTICMVINQLN